MQNQMPLILSGQQLHNPKDHKMDPQLFYQANQLITAPWKLNTLSNPLSNQEKYLILFFCDTTPNLAKYITNGI